MGGKGSVQYQNTKKSFGWDENGCQKDSETGWRQHGWTPRHKVVHQTDADSVVSH